MAISNPFSSDSSSAGSVSSADMKNAIMQQVRAESAISNARTLMEKINANCFDKCIPSPPGASLSSKDQTCLTACMEKYISIWNVTHRAYISRLGRERELSGMTGGDFMAGGLNGNEGSL